MSTTDSAPSHRAPNRPALGTGLVLGALALVVGAELFGPALRPAPAPVADYVEAARRLRAKLAPPLRIFVQPPWRDDVLDALDEARVLPPGVTATVALALGTQTPTPPALVLFDPDVALSSRLRRDLAGRTIRDFGQVRAAFIGPSVNPPAAPPAGKAAAPTPPNDGVLLDRTIAKATVVVEHPGRPQVQCQYAPARRRHECPGEPGWVHVGPERLQSGDEARACLWSHPVSGGHVKTTFHDVALGRELRLVHALANTALRSGNPAPVTATVRVDGQVVGTSIRDSRPGFLSATFPLATRDTPARGEVEVDVTVRDDGARHYCFSLEMLGAP